jgi:zinc protease
MKRLFAGLASALLLLAPAAQGRAAGPPASAIAIPPLKYETRTLANGLKVLTSLDRSTSNVTVQVWYGVGSKDDPAGRSGFAHLFEHMMFKATRDMPAESMDRLTEDVGGMNNASTADDYTNYFEVIPSNDLERLLWAESERMSSLVVDEANFHSEREVVKEELRQRVLAAPYGRFETLAIPQNSFAVHPYKRPGIGNIADLDAATLEDVRAFHATYYRPDDAVLVVVGNFDQSQLDVWVDRYFGPIKPPSAPLPRVTAVEPPRTGPRTVTTYGPNVPLPAVAITWLGAAAGSTDAPALTVLDALLSTGDSSRLYDSVVYRQQLAESVFSSAELRQQPGLVYVGAIMAGGKTPDQGEAALLAEVARLRDAPVDAAELDKAKSQLIAGDLRHRETVEGRGYALGYAYWVEGDAGRVDDDIGKLQAVTAADVQRVARQYLPDDRRVTIRYVAESQRPDSAVPAAPATPSSPVAAKSPTTDAAPAPPASEPMSPPPIGPPVAPRLPAPVERTLANGLRVIVAQSSTLPLVTAQLSVRTGAAVDPPAEAGLANMTAQLLTQGAGARTAPQVARDIEALGAQIESSAAWDGSNASVNVLTEKLPAALAILADVVRRPALSEGELERMRAQFLDALRVELQSPGALARYAAADAVFAGTPYGHMLKGTPASLKRITREDVAALHRAWYRPDNATLVLVGDITPEAGFALAQQAFGDWERPAAPLPVLPQPAPAARPKVIVIDLPGTGQAAVTLAMPGIRRLDPRFYQGLVANSVIGGGYSARLNEEIRVKRGLSYGASSALDARRGVGPFVAAAQTKNESAPMVVDLMLAELDRLRATVPEAGELAARKATLAGNFSRTVGTTRGLASYLTALALQRVPLSEINRYAPSVEAIGPQDVRQFAQATLDPKAATIVVAGDARLFLAPLRAKFPDLEVISAASLNLDSPTLH